MALFRRFFYKKPPDRLLEISERVYVFDCCFSTAVLDDDEYTTYLNGIVAQLQDHYSDGAFMAFNFKRDQKNRLTEVLSQFGMTIVDYPQGYEGCSVLPMEMILNFQHASEAWLSAESQQNVILMHCERGGWPVLAFMLAGLLLCKNQYTGGQKTLEMVYKQAPRELIHLLTPLNPQPSQIRYLNYLSRISAISEWQPSDVPLIMDCIILRYLPLYNGGLGCRPVIRLYGQNPSPRTPTLNPRLLFSSSKVQRNLCLYIEDECELVKIDIRCCVQGDIVVECIHLEDDLVGEEIIFRFMFHTEFVRSNVLTLTRDDLDILWEANAEIPKELAAEVLFSSVDSIPSITNTEAVLIEDGDEGEDSPDEFFEAEEIFSNVGDAQDAKGETDSNKVGATVPQDKTRHVVPPKDNSKDSILQSYGLDEISCTEDPKVDPADLLQDGDVGLKSSAVVTGLPGNAEVSEIAGKTSKSEVEENEPTEELPVTLKLSEKQGSQEVPTHDNDNQSLDEGIATVLRKQLVSSSKSTSIGVSTNKKSKQKDLPGSPKRLAKSSAVSRWIPSNKGSYTNSMHVYYPPSRRNSAPAVIALGKDSTSGGRSKPSTDITVDKYALRRRKHASCPSSLSLPSVQETPAAQVGNEVQEHSLVMSPPSVIPSPPPPPLPSAIPSPPPPPPLPSAAPVPPPPPPPRRPRLPASSKTKCKTPTPPTTMPPPPSHPRASVLSNIVSPSTLVSLLSPTPPPPPPPCSRLSINESMNTYILKTTTTKAAIPPISSNVHHGLMVSTPPPPPPPPPWCTPPMPPPIHASIMHGSHVEVPQPPPPPPLPPPSMHGNFSPLHLIEVSPQPPSPPPPPSSPPSSPPLAPLSEILSPSDLSMLAHGAPPPPPPPPPFTTCCPPPPPPPPPSRGGAMSPKPLMGEMMSSLLPPKPRIGVGSPPIPPKGEMPHPIASHHLQTMEEIPPPSIERPPPMHVVPPPPLSSLSPPPHSPPHLPPKHVPPPPSLPTIGVTIPSFIPTPPPPPPIKETIPPPSLLRGRAPSPPPPPSLLMGGVPPAPSLPPLQRHSSMGEIPPSPLPPLLSQSMGRTPSPPLSAQVEAIPTTSSLPIEEVSPPPPPPPPMVMAPLPPPLPLEGTPPIGGTPPPPPPPPMGGVPPSLMEGVSQSSLAWSMGGEPPSLSMERAPHPPPPPPPSMRRSSPPLHMRGMPPPPPPPPMGGMPPPPPQPLMGGVPPPPPPPLGGIPSPPPLPFMGKAPPPPPPPIGAPPPPQPPPIGRGPPPPPPFKGGAPLPPPLPMGAPPPPPPPIGRGPPPPLPPMGGVPPPPPPLMGGPPPPPPPGGNVPGPPAPPGAPRAPGGPPPPPGAPRAPGGPPPPPGAGRGLPAARGRGLTRSNASRRSNLKPLHWSKVTRALQGSLWEELQRHGEAQVASEFDVSEIETLFSAAPKTSGAKAAAQQKPASNKPTKVQLIDLKRAYNVEIMLTKVKMPLPDMMAAVLSMDDSTLDADQVENLIKFCPKKEEMETIKGYTGDVENLGKCEQFFMELMKAPRVETKLRVFLFKIQFNSQVSEFRHSLNLVNSACEEVRNSHKLKEIMKKILYLGNTLNEGTARGAAVGFKLDSLLKLTDTRASNSRMTLMHYLCKVLATKTPDLLDFHKDFVNLEPASKIQLKLLADEMQSIAKGIEKVKQELAASETDGPVSETFHKTLKQFVGSAEAEVTAVTNLYDTAGKNADALALYFGEDPKRCPFEQVTATLLNFVRLFQKAHEENLKQAEQEKKKAQKEAEIESAKGSSSSKNEGKD